MNEQILTGRPTFPAQLNMSHPLTRGLVGCWVMNDPSGMRAWDSSPYGNHGLVTVAKPRFDGFHGTGNDEMVNCGDDGSLDIINSISIEAWFKQDDANGVQHIIGRDDNTNRNYFLFTNGASAVSFAVRLGDVSQVVTTTASIVIGQYCHVVGTYVTGSHLIYDNGVQEGSTAPTGVIDNDDVPLTIGMRPTVNDRDFLGTIYMCRLWKDRVLTSREIKDLYLHPYAMFEK